MHLTALTIRHFRNIENLTWIPDPGINLIWGENGQGKTNLLEAIHLALVGRSFRTRAEEDCLPWNRATNAAPPTAVALADAADPTLAQVTLVSRAGERRLRVILARGAGHAHFTKRAYADGQWIARLADLWGMAAVVVFAPEDAALFKGPPAQRRRFLDMILSQTSRPYLDHLQQYSLALRQLNAVLKFPPQRRDVEATAAAFYPALAQAGAAIMQTRAVRLAEAAVPMRERYAALGGADALDVTYDPDMKRMLAGADLGSALGAAPLAELIAAYEARLNSTYNEARRLGAATVGVHRDDFSLALGGRDLRRFGSQGQHRLAALTLKLESAAWIARLTGEPPVLLLDDFGSELDPTRREAVLARLHGTMQVFITATHPNDLGAGAAWGRACRIERGALC